MATLTSTITEEVTLNGVERGASRSLSVSSVTQTFNRIVTCPSGQDTTVATFRTAVHTADGALDETDVKYLRITNLAGSNFVTVSIPIDTTGTPDGSPEQVVSFKLSAGRSFIFGAVEDSIVVDDDGGNPIAHGSLANAESISINANTADATVEVFIAS
jgi:hypothetical protein